MTQTEPYYKAREEHAFLLRCERLSYAKIGARLGVCGARAHQMIQKFSRRLRSATRKTKLRFTPPTATQTPAPKPPAL